MVAGSGGGFSARPTRPPEDQRNAGSPGKGRYTESIVVHAPSAPRHQAHYRLPRTLGPKHAGQYRTRRHRVAAAVARAAAKRDRDLRAAPSPRAHRRREQHRPALCTQPIAPGSLAGAERRVFRCRSDAWCNRRVGGRGERRTRRIGGTGSLESLERARTGRLLVANVVRRSPKQCTARMAEARGERARCAGFSRDAPSRRSGNAALGALATPGRRVASVPRAAALGCACNVHSARRRT